MQLIAIGTYPLLDSPMVDLVYRVAPGDYRIRQGVGSEGGDVELEPMTDADLIEWASAVGDGVVMVPGMNLNEKRSATRSGA